MTWHIWALVIVILILIAMLFQLMVQGPPKDKESHSKHAIKDAAIKSSRKHSTGTTRGWVVPQTSDQPHRNKHEKND